MTDFLEKLKDRFLTRPAAASWSRWEKWEKENKSNYPIRFFFLETAPTFISSNWRWWISEPIYNFKCKYIVKYHHIKIDVDRFMKYHKASFRNYHWIDSDGLILYGMFQILVDFMEEEADIVDWSADPDHQRVYNELRKLYKWWTEDRPNRDDSYPDSEDFGVEDIFGDNASKQPGYKAWRDACDEKEKIDREYDLEDTEMLIRLITIRRYMWT